MPHINMRRINAKKKQQVNNHKRRIEPASKERTRRMGYVRIETTRTGRRIWICRNTIPAQ